MEVVMRFLFRIFWDICGGIGVLIVLFLVFAILLVF